MPAPLDRYMTDRIKLRKDMESIPVARVFSRPTEAVKRRTRQKIEQKASQKQIEEPIVEPLVSPVKLAPPPPKEDTEEEQRTVSKLRVMVELNEQDRKEEKRLKLVSGTTPII